MTTKGKRLLLSIAAGALALSLAGTAQAASLGCYVLTVGVSGPFNGGPIQPRALITNTLSYEIAAGTVYSYVAGGHQFAHTASGPLAPGDTLSIAAQVGLPDGPCSASIPGRKIKLPKAPITGVLSAS